MSDEIVEMCPKRLEFCVAKSIGDCWMKITETAACCLPKKHRGVHKHPMQAQERLDPAHRRSLVAYMTWTDYK